MGSEIKQLLCVDTKAYSDALTYGKLYDVVAYDAEKKQVRVRSDVGIPRWYPLSCFTEDFNPEFELWLEFEYFRLLPGAEPGTPAFDPEDEACNILISLPSGERYALNVWTYKILSRIVTKDRERDEPLGGKYLLPPDLFVERLERELLEEVVRHLIQTSRLRPEWLVRSCCAEGA